MVYEHDVILLKSELQEIEKILSETDDVPKISLENWIRNKLDEIERMADFSVGTETVRCWIDEYKDRNLKKL